MTAGKENQTKRVMVVDDHPDMLDTLKSILTQHGFEVLTARNGQEALDLLQEQPINLVLSDVAMPHINGYQLFQALREASDPRLVAVPFIFISGRATLDSDIRYAKSLGVDDYLVKPVCQEDLLAVVKGKLLAAERLQQTFAPAPTLPNGYETVTLVIDQQYLSIDYVQHRAWLDEEEIQLTAKEIFLLEHLACQPNRIISTLQLFATTHGYQTTDQQDAGRLLRPIIRSLRKKLGEQIGSLIKNIRGRGYMLTGVRISDQRPSNRSS